MTCKKKKYGEKTDYFGPAFLMQEVFPGATAEVTTRVPHAQLAQQEWMQEMFLCNKPNQQTALGFKMWQNAAELWTSQPSDKGFARVEVPELNVTAGGTTHRSCGDKGLREFQAAGGKCDSH